MESKLDLDAGLVEACRAAPRGSPIASPPKRPTARRVSVERTVTRLLGVDGVTDLDVPLPNVLVDHVHDRGGLGRGRRLLARQRDAARPDATPQQIAEAVGAGELELLALPRAERGGDPRARRRASASGAMGDDARGAATSAASCASASASTRRRCATC